MVTDSADSRFMMWETSEVRFKRKLLFVLFDLVMLLLQMQRSFASGHDGHDMHVAIIR
jgi:hypothetical protein